MRLSIATRFLGSVILTVFLPFILGACQQAPPPPPKPAITGTGQTFVTNGNVDDGDPATGPPLPYVNPARTATDGQTVAISDPQSFRSLGGNVNVQTGPNPVRTATADANNTVTSTFVVQNLVNCQFRISSTGSATLNTGIGGFLAKATILNAAGAGVPGATFQIRYDFKENPNGQLDVSQNGQQFAQIANGGNISPIDTGPAAAFALPPGNYTLEFKLTIDGKADTSAVIKTIATVDLV